MFIYIFKLYSFCVLFSAHFLGGKIMSPELNLEMVPVVETHWEVPHSWGKFLRWKLGSKPHFHRRDLVVRAQPTYCDTSINSLANAVTVYRETKVFPAPRPEIGRGVFRSVMLISHCHFIYFCIFCANILSSLYDWLVATYYSSSYDVTKEMRTGIKLFTETNSLDRLTQMGAFYSWETL